MNQSQGSALESRDEETPDDDLDTGVMLLLLGKLPILVKDGVENINKVLERELIEMVDVVQLLQYRKHSTARSGNDTVLKRDILDLCHNTFGFCHLP